MPCRTLLREACSASGESSSPADLIDAVLQHALFIHAQAPCPYAELRREASRAATYQAHPPQRRVRQSNAQRKASKLVAAMDSLLTQLPHAVEAVTSSSPSSDPVVAAVVLGSSVASPRVVYLLHLAGNNMAVPPQNGVRRLLRAIAVQCSELASIDPGVCRMHVLLRANRRAALPEMHFRARPGLRLRLRRAHVATVSAGVPAQDNSIALNADLVRDLVLPQPRERKMPRQQHSVASESMAMDTVPGGDASQNGRSVLSPAHAAVASGQAMAVLQPAPDDVAEALIWWQSRATIKGFRLPVHAS